MLCVSGSWSVSRRLWHSTHSLTQRCSWWKVTCVYNCLMTITATLHSGPTQASIFQWGQSRTFVLMSTCLNPFPTPFLPSIFNSKSIELLTGSAEVLVYYIQWWHHHFERGEQVINLWVKWTKQFLTTTMLKVNLCGPLHFSWGHMGPFHPAVMTPHPSGVRGVLRWLWLHWILAHYTAQHMHNPHINIPQFNCPFNTQWLSLLCYEDQINNQNIHVIYSKIQSVQHRNLINCDRECTVVFYIYYYVLHCWSEYNVRGCHGTANWRKWVRKI